jgi:hypothetical protein
MPYIARIIDYIANLTPLNIYKVATNSYTQNWEAKVNCKKYVSKCLSDEIKDLNFSAKQMAINYITDRLWQGKLSGLIEEKRMKLTPGPLRSSSYVNTPFKEEEITLLNKEIALNKKRKSEMSHFVQAQYKSAKKLNFLTLSAILENPTQEKTLAQLLPQKFSESWRDKIANESHYFNTAKSK